MIGRVVVGRQHRAIPDDVVGDVGARAVTRIGQRNPVVREVECRNVRRQAAAALLIDMDERVVDEDEPPAAGRGATLVQNGVIDVVEKVVEDGPLGKLIGEIDAAGNRAARVARIVGAGWVAMDVHENIAFDPGVGAVEIEVVVRGAVEDVVNDLQNGARPLASGEVDRVVKTPGVAEIIVPENAVATGGNPVDPMKALRTARGRVAGKNAVLNDERTSVERDVFHHGRGRPGAMIDENDRVIDVDLRVVTTDGCAATRVKIHVRQPALGCRVDEVQAAPVPRCGRILADANALHLGALRQDHSGAVDGDGRAGGDIDRCAGLDGQRDTARNGEVGADVVRSAGGCPGGIAGQRAGHVVRRRAGVVPDIDVGPGKFDAARVHRLDQNPVDPGRESDIGGCPGSLPGDVRGGGAVNEHAARLDGGGAAGERGGRRG